jgi:hypothetical protein
MSVPAAVTSQQPVDRDVFRWESCLESCLTAAGPRTVTCLSWPRSSNVIGSAITPSRVSVQRSDRLPRASAPTTRAVSAWDGEKKAGSMIAAGVGPSTITVPRRALRTASRAVAM